MSKYFGTDGLRAKAGEFPLDYDSLYIIGQILTEIFEERGIKKNVLIGKDTRESGSWIEASLCSGIKSKNGKVYLAGIIPTSAICYLTRKFNFSAGISISASHNPYEDNGIKIFGSDGIKIEDEIEEEIEKRLIERKRSKIKREEIIEDKKFSSEYFNFLKKVGEGLNGDNLKIVVDCANGAASNFAPILFSELGFDVIPINNNPDGKNINYRCGSLFPGSLSKEATSKGAIFGIAYDGDSDRAIWVDKDGEIFDGDHTLLIQAKYLKDKLISPFIIGTVMSNLGLEIALKKYGFKLIRTPVGDKYVLQEMRKRKSKLGGEQSGHTIFLDILPTGDGIVTTIQMLKVIVAEKKSLKELSSDMEKFPQILVNVKVKEKKPLNELPEIVNIEEKIKKEIGKRGRILLRYSGTEPKLRIMIEGENEEKIKDWAEEIASAVKNTLGDEK
ncbi:MAG: phosphoglucosamine mutase [Acidobacteriota bacterium]